MAAGPGFDKAAMLAALEEARKALEMDEVPVGAVVAAGGQIVATGHNRSVADRDPAGHAEIVALRRAGERLNNYRLTGASLYVTLEPCAMCVGAIAQARVSRVVFGAYDPKAGALGGSIDLSDSNALNHRFEIQGGLLADDCAAVLQEFFSRRRA